MSGRSSRSTLMAMKLLVEHARDGFVLEALVLHHVAPVAGRVADGEKDRLVLALRRGERLLAPRVPVHRIVRMLLQVRARGEDEAVDVPRRAVGIEVRRPRFGLLCCAAHACRSRCCSAASNAGAPGSWIGASGSAARMQGLARTAQAISGATQRRTGSTTHVLGICVARGNSARSYGFGRPARICWEKSAAWSAAWAAALMCERRFSSSNGRLVSKRPRS